MARILVTGVSGFVGSHLAELLLDQGHTVIGSIRPRSPRENIVDARLVDRGVAFWTCDLRDAYAARELVRFAGAEYVVHLAADSWVGGSWAHPAEIYQNNVIAQVNLLESLRMVGPWPTKIVIASSSEAYGLVAASEVPIREEQPFRPLSPYAVAKVTQDMMALQYYRSWDLPIVRARPFNTEGPRRGVHFAPSNFCWQVALAETGAREPVIHTGNLDARRDFTDVRDIVRGYVTLLEHGEPGEVYNMGSGVATSVGDILTAIIGMSAVPMRAEYEAGRARPSDVPLLMADATKIRQLGWEPTIPLSVTLADCLAYWRKHVV